MEWLSALVGSLATIGIAAIVKWAGGFLRHAGGQRTVEPVEAAVAAVRADEHSKQMAIAKERGKVEEQKKQKLREVEEAVQSDSPEKQLASILNEGGDDK